MCQIFYEREWIDNNIFSKDIKSFNKSVGSS